MLDVHIMFQCVNGVKFIVTYVTWVNCIAPQATCYMCIWCFNEVKKQSFLSHMWHKTIVNPLSPILKQYKIWSLLEVLVWSLVWESSIGVLLFSLAWESHFRSLRSFRSLRCVGCQRSLGNLGSLGSLRSLRSLGSLAETNNNFALNCLIILIMFHHLV